MAGLLQRSAGVGLLVAIVLVYWPSLHAPFLFDDSGAILNNPTIRDVGSLRVLDPPSDGSTTTGRPVVNLSFALNYALSGERVWSYHAVNILIHACSALALMGIVRRTIFAMRRHGANPLMQGRTRFATGERPGGNETDLGCACPFLAALVWALHPLQSETVVCIAQRTESLCGLFYLLTMYGFVRGASDVENMTPGHATRWRTVSVCACLLGMATKEVMVTAPVMVLLFDRTFFAGSFANALQLRRRYYIALGCTWILLAFLVAESGGARGSAAGFGLGTTTWSYLLQQAEAIVLYLRLSFWPHPLVLDYGNLTVQSAAEVWWELAIVGALLAVTCWALVRRPLIGFFLAAFFLILAPSSSIIPLVTQTIAEHRMYLPLGALVTGLTAAALVSFRGLAKWMVGAASVIFAALTLVRVQDYRSVVSIWSDTVAKVPGNPRAHNNLGWAFQQEGKSAQANVHFGRALELKPDYVSALYNWGVALLEQKRPAEAIAPLASATRLAPAHGDAHVNLGNALMQTRRPAEAVSHYESALRLDRSADAYFNLGVALVDLKRDEEARTHFETALRLDANLAEAHHQLARLAERAGRIDEAESRYREVLRLLPDHATAHARLGLLFARSQKLEPAAEHLRTAIRLRPDDADAHANLGNVLLLQSRPREALASYQEALRLRPDDPRTRENIQLARESLR